MAGTVTPKLNLIKPEVGANGNWGNELNQDLDILEQVITNEHSPSGKHGNISVESITTSTKTGDQFGEKPVDIHASGAIATDDGLSLRGERITRWVNGKPQDRAKTAINMKSTGILIPLYIYPTNIYTNPVYNMVIDLAKRYPEVNIHVILNPGIYEYTDINQQVVVDYNYVEAFRRLQGAGVRCFAYVPTGFYGVDAWRISNTPVWRSGQLINAWADGSTDWRPIDSIKGDIQLVTQLYPWADGIFFDEYSNLDDITVAQYYKSIKEYAHSVGFDFNWGNAGAIVPEVHYKENAMDGFMIWETNRFPTQAEYDNLFRGAWAGSGDDLYKGHKAMLVHSQPTLDDVELNKMKWHSSWIYITDDIMPNPWDTLPTYFEDLVKRLSVRGDFNIKPDGFSELAGGLLMQWGTIPTPIPAASSGSVIFPKPFLKGCHSLVLTPNVSDGAGPTSVRRTALSLTGFSWESWVGGTLTTLSGTDTISWVAIGE